MADNPKPEAKAAAETAVEVVEPALATDVPVETLEAGEDPAPVEVESVEEPTSEPEPAPDMRAVPVDDIPKRLFEADNVDHNDAAVSASPPRNHETLAPQLHTRWSELKDFARTLQGDIEGELGEVLAFVRSKL